MERCVGTMPAWSFPPTAQNSAGILSRVHPGDECDSQKGEADGVSACLKNCLPA